MLFVAAAGNSGQNIDAAPQYPAAFNAPNLISVAATGGDDVLASFSNWGPTRVHLGAPGVSIISTTPGGAYGYLSGTSMATPHVPAQPCCCFPSVRSTQPDLRTLLANVDPVASPGVQDGHGRPPDVNQRFAGADRDSTGNRYFVGTDSTTRGSWKSTYGSEGLHHPGHGLVPVLCVGHGRSVSSGRGRPRRRMYGDCRRRAGTRPDRRMLVCECIP
jgi:subtilisin family serine protease